MGSNQLSSPPRVFVHGDTSAQTDSFENIQCRTTSDSHVLKFVSRADQLQLRGRRNYDRYMRVIKKYVSFDGPKHAQWQKESAEDAVWDAEWNKRHGPVPNGARILPWRREHERDSLHAEVPSPSTEVVV